jgi:hypothetical protein
MINPLIVPARYNFLYFFSRPALRAAASGSCPRAANDTVGAEVARHAVPAKHPMAIEETATRSRFDRMALGVT